MVEHGTQLTGKKLIPSITVEHSTLGMISSDYPYISDTEKDLAIGRLPVRSIKGLTGVINKIINYEKTIATGKIGFVNGDYVRPQDAFAEVTSEAIIDTYIENKQYVDRIYFMPQDDRLIQYQAGPRALTDLMRNGLDWLEFRGHGAGGLWGGLLDNGTASTMATRGKVPVIVSISCFTAAFTDLKEISLAEGLLRNPSGGAVAYIGNVGHGKVYGGHNLSMLMWQELTSGNSKTIGEVLFGAKRNAVNHGIGNDLLNSVILFGDPAMKVDLSTTSSF